MNVRHAARFSALASLLLLAAGCWDYSDIESRAPILGLGFDQSGDPDKPVLVSAEVPIASAAAPTPGGQAGNDGRPPKVVFESTGATVSEAIDMLNEVMARAPVHRHVAALVVSRDVAAGGIAPLVDYFLRNSQVNLRAQLWVTDGVARDVLGTNPAFQPYVSFGLESALLKSLTFPAIPRGVTIENFSRRIGEGGAVVPRVEVAQDGLKISGAGVFSSEARFVGFLNEVQTVGTGWFLGSFKKAEATFPCPVGEGSDVSVTLRPGGRRLEFEERWEEADPEGGTAGLIVRMRISGTVEVSSLGGCKLLPWTKAEDRRLLAEAAARAVQKDVEAAVHRAQELGVDFLRIGLQLSRRKPQLWKVLDWPALFPKIQVAVSVRMTVDDPGGIHDWAVAK